MGESPFNTNGDQWAWSATTLDWFKACPRLYYYNMILGIRPKGTNDHIKFGVVYHAALELYDRETFKGADHETALRSALRYALIETRGWQSAIPEKSRETVVRAIVWYIEEFRDDPIQTVRLADGSPAVELSFRLELTQNTILCGHLDRIGMYGEGDYVTDRKTTKSGLTDYYWSRFSPNTQITLYAVAGEVVFKTPVKGVIVDAAQTGVTFTRFHRRIAPRSRGQLDEFLRDAQWWIAQVPAAKAAGWPMNESSCQRYGGCAFAGVCSKAPHVRAKLLETEFELGDYNPLEVRGE